MGTQRFKHFQKVSVPKRETILYPHFIVYDFEALFNKEKAQISDSVSQDAIHIPSSVSIVDSLNKEPEHICFKDPKCLGESFMEAIEHRAEQIRQKIKEEFLPDCFGLLPKTQQQSIGVWCNQVSCIRF